MFGGESRWCPDRARPRGHRFGGAWTELKLDAVNYYLDFYTKVLKDKPTPRRPFELWYIDAFAGSGSRRVDRATGGLLEGLPIGEETVDLAGSVLRALDVDPPFKRLVFIERNRTRFDELVQIAEANPDRNIEPIQGDANDKLRQVFATPPWSSQRDGRGAHRAIVFLDPFGMSVRWETLRMLAETRAVDVWYLFPIGAVNRQLASDFARVDDDKRRALNEIFGTPSWREEIYVPSEQSSMFDFEPDARRKTLTNSGVERYAQKQLRSLFSYVSEPLPLLNDHNVKTFSLFCLANSVSPAANALIKNGVASVLKKYG